MAVMNQLEYTWTVENVDSLRPGDPCMAVYLPWPTAPGLQRQSAPETESAVNPEGLSFIDGHEADSHPAQPAHHAVRFWNQPVAQVRIRAIADQTSHVREELVNRIVPEIRALDVRFSQVRSQGPNVFHAVIGEAEGSRSKA